MTKEEKIKKKSKLENLQHELDELKDKYLRSQADFDNFRKRMQKEKAELIKFANESILTDFLEVMDNFDRAMGMIDSASDMKTVIEGIKMVQLQFHSELERRGLKYIECKGKPFDPHQHEAISYIEREDVEADHVIEDVQKGYVLNDKVIRYAKVVVAKGKDVEINEIEGENENE